MKRQANASKSDNEADALELSSMFNAIATSQAPTVALVNGAAFGGAMVSSFISVWRVLGKRSSPRYVQGSYCCVRYCGRLPVF